MDTSSGAYELNHECASTRTSTHNLFPWWNKGTYVLFRF